MMHQKGSVRFVIAISLIIILLGSFVYGMAKPVNSASSDITYVSVKPGMTADTIGSLLYEQGLIKNVLVFRIIAKIHGLDNTLKAGDYSFTKNMPVTAIVEKLARGEVSLRKITIPEGYTVDQIANLIKEKKLADPEKFKEHARNFKNYPYMEANKDTIYQVEGFIFPDTYEIANGASEEQLLAMMVDEFNKRFTDDMREKANQLGLPVRDVIILASLVEKEARIDSERPLIAGVFLNRLKNDMPLQSCATIQYILGYPKPELTIQDTKIVSPYNTYINMGLPPGPIANPGTASINAVLNASQTEYLYFVADEKGHHHFSKTYEEHLLAIERVQK
ncbi:endolytic transglycosylase MltG [Dendrosporobacter sp. 1207_IL3150]|uniref:endolytic transglycosylase MltG n=1 Tax=Dendrosporobacter sp. 1207_IL3150 TaxID=3084054 RepID=UPI002FD87E30